MKAELIPIDGGPPILINRDITVIGRREYCDVQLDDPSLSKRHCVLVKTDGLLMIRDLATTNGTRVKGQMIRWAALLPNDRITLGKIKFRVFLGPDTPAISAPEKIAQTSASEPRSPKIPEPSPPAGLSTSPAAALVAPAGLLRGDPGIDVDDSRWFDRMGSVSPDDLIIDLD